jgi:cell wall-associated NlpC family hydrolase/SH3-like domain-containing protein
LGGSRLRGRWLRIALIASAALMVLAGPAAATEQFITGDQAVVSGTGSVGLNIRSGPSIDSNVHFVADEGTSVEITGEAEVIDGVTWYPVLVNGQEAWVMADYIDSITEAPVSPSNVVSQASGQVMITNTDGHGLRLRAGASSAAETVTVMPEGYVLEIVGDDQTDDAGVTWAGVAFNGTTGFAHRGYLQPVSSGENESASEPAPEEPVDNSDNTQHEEPADNGDNAQHEEPEAPVVEEPEPEPTPEPEPGNTNGVAVGGNAEIVNTSGYGLNIRHGAGYGHGVVTVANEGDVVHILDGPQVDAEGSNWWHVDYRGLSGWAHGGYLQVTDAEPTSPGTSSGASNPDNGEEPNPPAASGVGEQIAAEAMKFLGYPYVWGGTSPSGFDCSGYIYYVVNQVTGGGFPRGMEAQVNQGTFVPSDQLQPGDIVFQQNTYQWGLSHAGIYIGNGQFIHASTPGTGVIISDLWDSYWGPRYYTARRIS